MVSGEPKVATVDSVESLDNMATLPVSQRHALEEKNNSANKEAESKGKKLKEPKELVDEIQPKRTSLFIIMSFIYAKLLVVICIAYVISEVVTHNIPHFYYEGFFTYLYGVSILFLLYVFCFLLQESSCCNGSPPKEKKTKPVKEKKEKPKKEKPPKKEKEKKEKGKDEKKEEGKTAAAPPPAPPPAPQPGEKGALSSVLKELKKPDSGDGDGRGGDKQVERDAEEGAAHGKLHKSKTSQNFNSHGSFFLRVGAIVLPVAAFGLGTMIYNGLELGKFLEIPLTSPCFLVLQGVNPLLQMIFTFMQMYFIFMNARLNIHRFKLVARFGLMHVVATNLCVWIRTLVVESLKEITQYHVKRGGDGQTFFQDSVRDHSLRNKDTVLGTHVVRPDIITTAATTTAATLSTLAKTNPTTSSRFVRILTTPSTLRTTLSSTIASTTTRRTTTTPTTTTRWTLPTTSSTTTSTTTTSTPAPNILNFFDFNSAAGLNQSQNPIREWNSPMAVAEQVFATTENATILTSADNGSIWDAPVAEPWFSLPSLPIDNSTSCHRVDIMGSIVQDAAPYLYPFIIEYSLIGAAVVYTMWRHIGRYPRYIGSEDLEKRLEAMLSHRAVALARAHNGRVDCVGASKGLFFGLLLLVGSLICLILFFVLIQHKKLGLLAIYLADASHCGLLLLSILAIIIGFIRVQSLKFKTEQPSDLNDILLRISAFGLFVYAVFSVIAGALNALTHEPNLLVTVTGLLAIFQVVLQLLFIADVSRRRVHLPEHDRSKPGRQIVTFLLILNVTMWIIYTFEAQKVLANPVQLDFYGFLAWSLIQRVTLPLCIFHRFHSAVTLAEIWKTTYKARLE